MWKRFGNLSVRCGVGSGRTQFYCNLYKCCCELRLSSWMRCERLCDAFSIRMKKERKIQMDGLNEWKSLPHNKIQPKYFIETAIHPYVHHSIWRKRLFVVIEAVSLRFVTISSYFFFYIAAAVASAAAVVVAVVFVTVFFIWKYREWVNSTIYK